MVLTTVYVTRHGFRSNWLKDVPIPEPPTGIPSDPVLAKHGEDQAEELGEYLSHIEPSIQRIYSSPFYRCLQTATPAAEKLGLEIYAENGIGEWYQPGRATHPSPAPLDTLKGFFPKLNDKYEPLVVPSKSGETIHELHERCKETLAKLVRDINSNPDSSHISTILLVSHAAPKAAISPAFTNDHKTEVRTGVCSLDKYELKPGASGENPGDWVMTMNGYTEFLNNGEEMHWSFDNPYEPGSTEDIQAREKGLVKDTSKGKGSNDAIESVYLPIDLGNTYTSSLGGFSNIPTQADFQISGLETDTPLFKIGDAIYQGAWSDVVGTEVFIQPDGQAIGKSRQRIVLKQQQVSYKSEKTKSETLMEKVARVNDMRDSTADRQS